MMQRSHIPGFKPHLSENYEIPTILKGKWPPKAEYLDAERGKFVFLLDRSGSMTGTKLELAKEALSLFLQSLPPHSEFQVLSFGSDFTYLLNTQKLLTLDHLD